MTSGPAPYPAHWEADVVLRDGGTAHLRPITPDDADRLRRFHSRLSDQTIYFRFFALYRELTDKDIARFTQVDHVDRAALLATVGGEMIGVVRYERVTADEAEVAFNIEDAHQGRGIGSVFLEHIAAAARENGISRFVADVLPTNRKMLRVFSDAGYVVRHALDDGILRLGFDLEPTEDSIAVTHAREHRAEARSVERLLKPRSVAVVGASRQDDAVGAMLLRHLVDGGFTGEVYAVNAATTQVAGRRAYPTVSAVPREVDLALVAVPAEEVDGVVADCAAKGVRGLVVVSGGFADTDTDAGRALQRRLVAAARGSGMRVVGPSSFGLLNTDPSVSLNASMAPALPPVGPLGFFSQSGALGVALLDHVVRGGLGLSSFVSAGNRVDVSGSDLMQFWEDDDATAAVMLYLESFGNPRKFSRIARRLARRKPVVVVKAGRSSGTAALGHQVRASRVPGAALEALFAQAGVIRVDSIHQLFDVGRLLSQQPLPAGDRVHVVGNAASLVRLAQDACTEAGLAVHGAQLLPGEADADEAAGGLRDALEDPAVDSVVAVFMPPLRARDEEVGAALAAVAADAAKPVVSTFLGMRGLPEVLRADGSRRELPAYPTPEEAVAALAAATRYAQWRSRPAGHTVQPSGLDVRGARALVADVLAGAGDGETVELDHATLTRLLACYGIELWPLVPAPDLQQALAAADQVGYPVVLKTLAPHLRHRSDLGGVRLDIPDAAGLAAAHATMQDRLGPGSGQHFAVQTMAAPGVSCVVSTVEDPLLGPVVSFGVGGVATELLDDVAYAVPPLTDSELASLVRSVRASPLLLGHRGTEPVDVAGLTDVLARVARLGDDLPEVAELSLNPVHVAPGGPAVLAAYGRLERPAARSDRGPRSLLAG